MSAWSSQVGGVGVTSTPVSHGGGGGGLGTPKVQMSSAGRDSVWMGGGTPTAGGIWSTPRNSIDGATTPGSQRNVERLPNYLMSSGYTPTSKSEPRQDERVASLIGSVNIYSSKDKNQAYNERLRVGGTPAKASVEPAMKASSRMGTALFETPARSEPVSGFTPTPGSAQRSTGGRPPPRRSMLDEIIPDVNTSSMRDISHPETGEGAHEPRGLFSPERRAVSASPMDTGIISTPAGNRKAIFFSPDGGTPGENDGQGRWVTVFGFGPAMQSLVLREFRTHGDIVRHLPGKGNWIHILVRLNQS